MLGRLRRSVGFLGWMLPALTQLIARGSAGTGRRLLAIYDLSCQPFSIGDILVIQEASLVLRHRHGLSDVDFAIVCDPEHPALDPAFATITQENVMFHVAKILPTAQINPHLGSLFVFDSSARLERFIADTPDLYHVWPTAWRYATREYLYYSVFNDLLYQYHEEHKCIPSLSSPGHLVRWAEEFYKQHLGRDIPVTVQIRNNATIAPHRNVSLKAWKAFFAHCARRYPVKFVIICSPEELDSSLREFPNVVVAKDSYTSLEQDLALVQTAAIHMGASSGPGTVAIFNTRPYLLVNTDVKPYLYRDMIEDGDFLRFSFASPLQRLARGAETVELLISELDRMVKSLDARGW